MKFKHLNIFAIPILSFFLGCAQSKAPDYSWVKKSASSVSTETHKKECAAFAERLLDPEIDSNAERTRYAVYAIDIDSRTNWQPSEWKNRKLIIDWCMKNEGYEKKFKETRSER